MPQASTHGRALHHQPRSPRWRLCVPGSPSLRRLRLRRRSASLPSPPLLLSLPPLLLLVWLLRCRLFFFFLFFFFFCSLCLHPRGARGSRSPGKAVHRGAPEMRWLLVRPGGRRGNHAAVLHAGWRFPPVGLWPMLGHLGRQPASQAGSAHRER